MGNPSRSDLHPQVADWGRLYRGNVTVISNVTSRSIYENFNEMKYELFKMWVYNDIKYRNKIEFTLELIEYLKNKEYYTMNDVDKLLLHIIYLELTQIKSNNI